MLSSAQYAHAIAPYGLPAQISGRGRLPDDDLLDRLRPIGEVRVVANFRAVPQVDMAEAERDDSLDTRQITALEAAKLLSVAKSFLEIHTEIVAAIDVPLLVRALGRTNLRGRTHIGIRHCGKAFHRPAPVIQGPAQTNAAGFPVVFRNVVAHGSANQGGDRGLRAGWILGPHLVKRG